VALENASGGGRVAKPARLDAMLRAGEKISDLIFSPRRPPQVHFDGQMIPVRPLAASNSESSPESWVLLADSAILRIHYDHF